MARCVSLDKLLHPFVTPFLVRSQLSCNIHQLSREGGKHCGEREGVSVNENEPMDNALRVWLEIHTSDIIWPSHGQ